MEYTDEEILDSFSTQGAEASSFKSRGGFIESVTFRCTKPECNCVGHWETKVGRTVAAQMGEDVYSGPPVERLPRPPRVNVARR